MFLTTLASTATTALFACTDDTTTATPGGGVDGSADGAADGSGNGDVDGGGSGDGNTTTDAPSSDAKPAKDANGAGGVGADCAFNRECQAALRCECSESTGCACKPGPRGTGKNGIDACDSGEQCASSVCVESATDNQFLCSDECTDGTDCEPALPRCLPTFGFPTPICVRQPPM